VVGVEGSGAMEVSNSAALKRVNSHCTDGRDLLAASGRRGSSPLCTLVETSFRALEGGSLQSCVQLEQIRQFGRHDCKFVRGEG